MEKQQEERYIDNQKKKKEKEDHMTIKTQEELSQEKAPKMNRNIIGETQIERSEKCRREKTFFYVDLYTNILFVKFIF